MTAAEDRPPTDEELLAFCDEMLPVEEMTRIERLIRESPALQQRLRELTQERDKGLNTVGALWRANRLSCPDRDELGAYLLRALSKDAADYVAFHLEVVGCRYCRAELEDLQRMQEAAQEAVTERRRKFYQSSLRFLPSRRSE